MPRVFHLRGTDGVGGAARDGPGVFAAWGCRKGKTGGGAADCLEEGGDCVRARRCEGSEGEGEGEEKGGGGQGPGTVQGSTSS